MEPTGTHRLYSEDRGDWVPAADLAAGERLQTLAGPATITRIDSSRPGVHRVCNLEVGTEHCYTVPRLLDVAGALDALPALPPIDRPDAQRAKATGTDGRTFLVPTLVPDSGKTCTHGSQAGTSGDERLSGATAVSAMLDADCGTTSRHGSKPPRGFEPRTCGLQNRCSAD